MTTSYVPLTGKKTDEKIETSQDMYFWGVVIAVLVLLGVVLLVLYGLQTGENAEDVPLRSLGPAAPGMVLAQLPLYLNSTLFSDPAEDV